MNKLTIARENDFGAVPFGAARHRMEIEGPKPKLTRDGPIGGIRFGEQRMEFPPLGAQIFWKLIRRKKLQICDAAGNEPFAEVSFAARQMLDSVLDSAHQTGIMVHCHLHRTEDAVVSTDRITVDP